ncbi:hypothetical protein D9M72_526110 [compost metagenome]
MRVSHSATSASSSALSAASWSTSPIATAASPLMRSPVRPRRRVAAAPMRCTTNGAICAAMMPSVVSDSAKRASRVASTMSAAHARPMPPPIAAPSTAAMTGTGSALSRCMK